MTRGSNWGQARHPARPANLLAHPAARVTLGEREFDVPADPVGDAERERPRHRMDEIWPGHTAYAERGSTR